jgi:import receptor subunit TOM70
MDSTGSGGGAPVFPPTPIQITTSGLSDSASSGLWDRISSWASDNKALVYTIAGVTLVVTAAGVVYYTSESQPSPSTGSSSPLSRSKANKKAKRKAKKEAEEQAKKGDDEKAKTGRSCH